VVALGVALAQAAFFIGVAMLPFFGLHLAASAPLGLPVLVLGTTAFFTIGLLVGTYASSPDAIAAIANCIMLPMAFFSGTFFPVEALPPFLQPLAWLTPPYHGAVLARSLSLGTFGTSPTIELALIHLAILLGFIVVGTWAAIRTIDARLVRG